MAEYSSILTFVSYIFDLLAVVCGILSIISFARTDRRYPYKESRKRSINKGFLFLFLTLLTMMTAEGFTQPNNLETVVFCTLGGVLVLSLSFGIAHLQITYLGKNAVVKSLTEKDKPDQK